MTGLGPIALPEPAALGRCAVLLGGRSAEREVSLMSGQGVLAALRSRSVEVIPFDPAERALDELTRERVQRVFIALHGRYGEDGTVQGALELLGIPYTGSGVLASAIGIDKCTTKRLWMTHGLPTPAFRIARSPQQVQEAAQALGLPMAVKPAREGSSLGFTRLTDLGQVRQAFEAACRLDGDVLCEQFIAGRELTVAILGRGESAQALPVIEIVAPAGNYDYTHKYFTDETRYDCPAALSEPVARRVTDLALQAFRAVGCEGWGRVDVMLRTSDDEPFLLEVNTSPGMTGHSLVPMAARAIGLSYEDLCLHLLGGAALKTGGCA